MAHYLKKDLAGFYFNSKYPPNVKINGTHYGGYRNNAEEVLFYNFAVQGYDVSFTYKGQRYYLVFSQDHVATCDSKFTEEFEVFANANELIEKYQIDGKTLLELMDELEDVEPE